MTIKKTVMRALLSFGSFFAASRVSQSFLQKVVMFAQYLQGIGSGADVSFSGEKVALSRLRQRRNAGHSLCIFDVGANKGHYLRLAAESLSGLNFHVHCFEPAHGTFQQLCKEAEDIQNATVNNFGLGGEIGEGELFYDEVGSGLASLTRRRLNHFNLDLRLSEKVRIETVDNYCSNHNIERIDLLKIDVEGHELAVLQGSKRMFSNSAIDMVAFEFGGCNIDTRTFVQDFYYFFRDYNMRIARITPSGYLVELPAYQEIDEQFRTTNFLCFRA